MIIPDDLQGLEKRVVSVETLTSDLFREYREIKADIRALEVLRRRLEFQAGTPADVSARSGLTDIAVLLGVSVAVSEAENAEEARAIILIALRERERTNRTVRTARDNAEAHYRRLVAALVALTSSWQDQGSRAQTEELRSIYQALAAQISEAINHGGQG